MVCNLFICFVLHFFSIRLKINQIYTYEFDILFRVFTSFSFNKFSVYELVLLIHSMIPKYMGAHEFK